jgi:hypothetical protein
MMTYMTTTLLETILALTAAAALCGVGSSLLGSWWRVRVFRRDGLNGLRLLHAYATLGRDACRFGAALTLAVSAYLLLRLPADTGPAALIAKHALMILGWFMLLTVVADIVTRAKVAHAFAHEKEDPSC